MAEALRKIFFLITSSDFGGAETLLEDLVLALDRTRFQPFVCSVKPGGRMLERLAASGVPTASLEFDWRPRPFNLAALRRAFGRLVALLRDWKPDAVHTSLFQADLLGTLAAARAGVPVRLVTVHMVMKKKLGQLLVERGLAPWVTRYVSVSKALERTYVRSLALPAAKITVIYNGVDSDEVRRRAESPAPSSPSGTPGPWIVGLGRLDAQKRWHDLLSAAALLAERKRPFQLVLIGDGPLREVLFKQSDALGLTPHLWFAGFHANPMPLVAKAAVVVLPSGEEGLPLVLLEAMALRKPVIATAVGAVPELVEEGDNGYLVSVGDSEALADRIERLLSDPALAERMGRQGAGRVEERFDRRDSHRQMQSLYNSLMTERGRS